MKIHTSEERCVLKTVLMKKLLFIVVALFTVVSMNAQEIEYESLLSESKVWTMVCYKSNQLSEIKLVGDTVINGIHFMQKYERLCEIGEEMSADWVATDEYLGQDGGKIYLFSSRTKRLILDMDFSLKVGDKIGCYDVFYGTEPQFIFVVESVSDKIIDSSTDKVRRKCVYLEVDDPDCIASDEWIEGIGSAKYGIAGEYLLLASGNVFNLMKCTDGDTILYLSDTYAGIKEAKASTPAIDSTYYTLSGIRVTKPRLGIYIHDGKKKLMK